MIRNELVWQEQKNLYAHQKCLVLQELLLSVCWALSVTYFSHAPQEALRGTWAWRINTLFSPFCAKPFSAMCCTSRNSIFNSSLRCSSSNTVPCRDGNSCWGVPQCAGDLHISKLCLQTTISRQVFYVSQHSEIILSSSKEKYFFIQSKISNTVAEVYNIRLAKRKENLLQNSVRRAYDSLFPLLFHSVPRYQTGSKPHLIHMVSISEPGYNIHPKYVFMGGSLHLRRNTDLQPCTPFWRSDWRFIQIHFPSSIQEGVSLSFCWTVNWPNFFKCKCSFNRPGADIS